MRSERAGRDHLHQATSATRLARQFRDDVHAAIAPPAPGDAARPGWRIELAPGKQSSTGSSLAGWTAPSGSDRSCGGRRHTTCRPEIRPGSSRPAQNGRRRPAWCCRKRIGPNFASRRSSAETIASPTPRGRAKNEESQTRSPAIRRGAAGGDRLLGGGDGPVSHCW